MIPIVDHRQCVADLNAWGWRDYKIDLVCGFTGGYVAQIKCGNIALMSQDKAARLYNLWEQEAHERGVHIPPYGSPVPREPLHTQAQSVTS